MSNFDFEGGIQRLDEIIDQIEGGDTPLEQSLALYKEGIALAADCAAVLNGIEAEVMVLQQSEEGLVLTPFKGSKNEF